MIIYGVYSKLTAHTDVAKTLKGAKRYATINGYNIVTSRNVNTGYATLLFEKINGKWKPYR